MMKQTALAAALCGPLCAALAPAASAKDAEGTVVSVLGRHWAVFPVADAAGRYSATRMNLEHLPFRPPAVLTARQAVRALRAATGCSVNIDTMVRNITGTYYAQMICRK
ncbi:hypothetical protein [Leisingera methylohalidivorans]|uniref:Uncharacterized protein n=1 Tax=Leisingera methylohalidivorans DSM 14336 TaxID=999552 RepID=V9VUH2_9RHOB|nr:hypothetical protein [Leisingera methylohalidivorans]AHD01673.1 hypothetical protein METH_14065 [Leisingera methylohalidivorans DSM 14336]